jgi:hypothetical protein
MSQRLLKFPLSDDAILLPFFMGAAEGDDVEEETDTDGDGDSEDDKDGNTDSDGDTDKSGTVSPDEYEKLKKRMQAADRRASQAEAKAKQYEDRDKDALEVASERIKELEAAVKAKEEVLRKQGLENAFHASNTITWHNPSLALKELDLDGVQDEETGEIDRTALKRNIEKLAKAQPYLVKTDADSNGGKPKGKSGSNPGGSPQGNNGGKDADRALLEKKYPALRGR